MSLYQKASLVQIPSGYKASADKLYSVVPSNGDGDFTVDSSPLATRVNKDGLIESVVADQARLNYDPTNPQDPHLLLEPSRTNNASRSETPQDGSWSDPLSEWTLLTETTTSPRGDQTRVFNLEDSTGTLIRCQDFSVAAGTYTISFYIKDIGGNFTGGIVDLGDQGSGDTTPSLSTVGSEWVRVSRTITTTSTKTFLDIQLYFTGSTNKVGIWGLQLEAGSQSTSYIQTTGTAAVTRTADFVSGGGDANLFNDSEGTLFVEAKVLDNNTSKINVINISDGTLANRVLFQWGGALNRLRTYLVVSYSNQTLIETTSYNTGDYLKIAVRYKTNDVAFYVNGTKVNSDTTANTFPNGTLNTIDFTNGNLGSDYYFDGSLKQLMYFDTALSDSELQTLTS
tara:strand:+ start:22893 stop:24083 length:1191 start_codon:yes stop_codon:yes gene_type:complete